MFDGSAIAEICCRVIDCLMRLILRFPKKKGCNFEGKG